MLRWKPAAGEPPRPHRPKERTAETCRQFSCSFARGLTDPLLSDWTGPHPVGAHGRWIQSGLRARPHCVPQPRPHRFVLIRAPQMGEKEESSPASTGNGHVSRPLPGAGRPCSVPGRGDPCPWQPAPLTIASICTVLGTPSGSDDAGTGKVARTRSPSGSLRSADKQVRRVGKPRRLPDGGGMLRA